MAFRSKNTFLHYLFLLTSDEFAVLSMNLGNSTEFTTTNKEVVELVVLKHEDVRVGKEAFKRVHSFLFRQDSHFFDNFVVKMWHNDVERVIAADLTVSILAILLVGFQNGRASLWTDEINYKEKELELF